MNAKETLQSVKLFPTKRYITLIFHVTMLLLFLALSSGCGKDAPLPFLEQEQEQEQEQDPQEQGSIDIVPQEQDPQDQESSDPSTQNDLELVDSEVLYFMANHNIPGAAIAISIDEKMVYSKGYGFSNVEQNIATKADDVFRIASISKPFTSTAIMKLVDEGKLSLSDFVFGSDGILGDDFGTAELTEDELKITVDHLMIHAAGGWSVASGGDPIDYEPLLENNDFIEYLLNNWELTDTPGTSFAYSNTGYWLLARIIEKVSDQPFEAYVRALVSPTGITSFKTTEFTREDREANEVEYYGSPEEEQWIYSIASRRDGDGGVVISAPDLLRFICALDGRPNRLDLVSTSSLELMSQPSELSNLGRGLAVWEEQNILYFTGSLPGTRSWFYMETANGVNAVILLNYSSSDPQFDLDFNNLVTNLVKDTSVPWQTDLDLF